MVKVEEISNLDNKSDKTSHIFQVTNNLSSRIKEVFCKSPEIINSFWYKWRLDKCEIPNRVQEITDDWKKYLKITIKPWDKKDLWRWTERAEIQQSERINYDEEYIQNFSFQIPEDFALCPRRTVIRQWKRRPEITRNDAPLLSHRIKKIDDKYFLVLTDWNRDEIWKPIPMEDIIWKNINIENKIKFSDKWESVVSVKIWEETIYEWPIAISHPKKNKDKETQAYFKFGLYRDRYKYSIRKIKKDKYLTPEEKKVQIEEIERAKEKERTEDSYIFLKDYNIKKSV